MSGIFNKGALDLPVRCNKGIGCNRLGEIVLRRQREMAWRHLMSKTENTFAALGGVSGLAASKRTTDFKTIDKTAPILWPHVEMRRSDGWDITAVTAECKLQDANSDRSERVAAMLLRNHAVVPRRVPGDKRNFVAGQQQAKPVARHLRACGRAFL